jgi:hypothetical protein
MRTLTPKRLILVGLVLLGSAVIYAAVFVNIPFPDPSPAQAKRESLHLKISDILLSAGLAGVVAGFLWGAYRKLRP